MPSMDDASKSRAVLGKKFLGAALKKWLTFLFEKPALIDYQRLRVTEIDKMERRLMVD